MREEKRRNKERKKLRRRFASFESRLMDDKKDLFEKTNITTFFTRHEYKLAAQTCFVIVALTD